MLEAAFEKALGAAPSKRTRRVELDKDDPDKQTVLFHYPAAIAKREGEMARTMQPDIRLELGARGEQWPAEQARVVSYAAQTSPTPFKEPACEVKVLSIDRTFWEKATILHAWYHLPQAKPLPDRQSRHYFDLACPCAAAQEGTGGRLRPDEADDLRRGSAARPCLRRDLGA